MIPVRDHVLAEFSRLKKQLPGSRDLLSRRIAALDRFAGSGFPTTREENWKYTDLRLLEKYRFAALSECSDMEPAELVPRTLRGLDCHRLVFADGCYLPQLSNIGALPRGAVLTNMASAVDQAETGARLDSAVNGYRNAVTDLNSAFWLDGLYLHLADGMALDKPVHVLFFGRTQGMATLRNQVHLGCGSEAVVIEHYAGNSGDAQYLTNAVTEVFAGPGSRLARCKLQQESLKAFHLGSVSVYQERDSHVRLHSVDLGGRLVRNDSNSRLDAAGAEVHLYGVYAPAGRQHVDNHTRIDHAQPLGTSRESFKGVLDGHSRGVFNGRIVVHKGAQKTDSQQSSAALLLSKNAEVDAKPELEIYADDVRCAHGATVGQLDENAVFYLQSRGIDEAGARSLLTYSFADEVIREVRIDALRRHIEGHFLKRLPNGEQFRDLL